MRSLKTLLASLSVVCLLVPSLCSAIDPPVDNGVATLCIFTAEDLDVASNAIDVVIPFETYRLYFLLYNEQIASNILGGLGFSWRLEPTPTPQPNVVLNLPPGSLNFGSLFNLAVGFGYGVRTTDNHALVLTVDMVFLAPLDSPTYVYLGPAVPAVLPGSMEYFDFNNPVNVLPALPNSFQSQFENPVFGFELPIAAESSTWGGVKSLFRGE